MYNQMKPSEKLSSERDRLSLLAKELGIIDVKIFGSVARHTDTQSSDVDFLVKPNPLDFTSLYSFGIKASKILGFPVNVVEDDSSTKRHNPVLSEALREAVVL